MGYSDRRAAEEEILQSMLCVDVINCLPNDAAMKNRTDLNLGNVFLSNNYLSYT